MFLNDSVIYGVSNLGGDNNSGFIFSYNIHIKEIIQKHSFAKDSTGFVIIGPLVKGNNNILYGVQQHGGKNDFGDFFSFNILTNQYTSIWDFPTNDFGKL